MNQKYKEFKRKKHILIVDSSKAVAEFLQDIAIKSGYNGNCYDIRAFVSQPDEACSRLERTLVNNGTTDLIVCSDLHGYWASVRDMAQRRNVDFVLMSQNEEFVNLAREKNLTVFRSLVDMYKLFNYFEEL